MDPSRRLRVYVSLCHENPTGPVCGRDEPRVLAMVESDERRLLERLAERYLIEGRDKPVYVYGPMCDGMEEMVVVPRCQSAIALGVWDPYLNDYIVYSTLHGDSVMESEGFENFLEVTGKAAGLVRKAREVHPVGSLRGSGAGERLRSMARPHRTRRASREAVRGLRSTSAPALARPAPAWLAWPPRARPSPR